jgi:epsilon-lactone hydrolase
MATQQRDAVKELYLAWTAAFQKDPGMSLDERRNIIEKWGDVTAEPHGVEYTETDAAGVPAMWAVPRGCTIDRVVLSVHGGGYITGSMHTHRKLFAHIAKAIGCRALILNYRRSPEYVFPAALDDTFRAYRWLLDQGINAKHITITGDSAGGGIAVTALMRARDEGLPMAAASMPLSPWVDMEVVGETMKSNRANDAFFHPDVVANLVTAFLGPNGNRRDPLANPLYGDLTGLPPTYIQVGGYETLLDDSRRLAQRAKEAGVKVRLDVFPQCQHTFQFAAGHDPIADDAIRRLAEWVRPELGLSRPESHTFRD